MIKIKIIDESQQDNHFRGEHIVGNLKFRHELEIKFIPYIYGEKREINPPTWNDSMFNRIGDASVYLIHSSNILAIDLINYINLNYPNSYIIEYSGGGNEHMINRVPVGVKHCIYPRVVGTNGIILYLDEFIDALQKNQSEPLKILIDYNHKLNVALEFLHQCLGGAPVDTNILTVNELFEINKDAALNGKTKALKEWIDELKNKTGEAYNIALRDVRDILLKEAETTGEN